MQVQEEPRAGTHAGLPFDRRIHPGARISYFPASRIATRTTTSIVRTTYREPGAETRRLAGALDRLGLSEDARVGTFGWNSARHLALYFAVPSTGRVLHTINIRCFPEHIRFSIDHAEDEAVFVDSSLPHLLAPHLPHLPRLRHVVVMDDGGAVDDASGDSRIVRREDLLDSADEIDLRDRVADEWRRCALRGLCSTPHLKGYGRDERLT